MKFLGRIVTGVREGFAALLQSTEDPEDILEQTLWDMENQLIQMRRGVAQAAASFKRADRHRLQSLALKERWNTRAQIALIHGEEALAKEAITRSHTYQKTAQDLQAQVAKQQTFISEMRRNLRVLEERITQIKMQKDMYIVRIRTAIAQQQLHALKETIQQGIDHPDLENLEDFTWCLEAEYQLQDSLDAKFLALEKYHTIQKQD